MNIYGGNEPDPVFPWVITGLQLRLPPTSPLAPESQTWVPGTESSSPVASPAWPQPGGMGSRKRAIYLPPGTPGRLTGWLASKLGGDALGDHSPPQMDCAGRGGAQ